MDRSFRGSSSIYIENIGEAVLASDLKDKFNRHGKILKLVLEGDHAIVEFDNVRQAKAALSAENGSLFFGKRLNVKRAADKTRTDDAFLKSPPAPPPSPSQRPPQSTITAQPHAFKILSSMLQTHFTFEDVQRSTSKELSDETDDDEGKNNLRSKQLENNIEPCVEFGNSFEECQRDKENFPADHFIHGEKFTKYQQLRDLPANYVLPNMNRPRKNDCEIVVTSKSLTNYATCIMNRLRKMGLTVDLLYPNTGDHLGGVLVDIVMRGCLYAILIMPEHEKSRSITLNILRGTTQDYRNIHVDEAMVLIRQKIDACPTEEKLNLNFSGSENGSLTDRHPEAMQVLFNLLAENRQITSIEYDLLIKYLGDRRKLQRQFEESEANELNTQIKEGLTSEQTELLNEVLGDLGESVNEDVLKSTESSNSLTYLLNDPSIKTAFDNLPLGGMFKGTVA